MYRDTSVCIATNSLYQTNMHNFRTSSGNQLWEKSNNGRKSEEKIIWIILTTSSCYNAKGKVNLRSTKFIVRKLLCKSVCIGILLDDYCDKILRIFVKIYYIFYLKWKTYFMSGALTMPKLPTWHGLHGHSIFPFEQFIW